MTEFDYSQYENDDDYTTVDAIYDMLHQADGTSRPMSILLECYNRYENHTSEADSIANDKEALDWLDDYWEYVCWNERGNQIGMEELGGFKGMAETITNPSFAQQVIDYLQYDDEIDEDAQNLIDRLKQITSRYNGVNKMKKSKMKKTDFGEHLGTTWYNGTRGYGPFSEYYLNPDGKVHEYTDGFESYVFEFGENPIITHPTRKYNEIMMDYMNRSLFPNVDWEKYFPMEGTPKSIAYQIREDFNNSSNNTFYAIPWNDVFEDAIADEYTKRKDMMNEYYASTKKMKKSFENYQGKYGEVKTIDGFIWEYVFRLPNHGKRYEWTITHRYEGEKYQTHYRSDTPWLVNMETEGAYDTMEDAIDFIDEYVESDSLKESTKKSAPTIHDMISQCRQNNNSLTKSRVRLR